MLTGASPPPFPTIGTAPEGAALPRPAAKAKLPRAGNAAAPARSRVFITGLSAGGAMTR